MSIQDKVAILSELAIWFSKTSTLKYSTEVCDTTEFMLTCQHADIAILNEYY